MTDNQIDTADGLFIIGLAVAALVMVIYLLFFDEDNHETEIDNIYKQLQDNSKMEKQIQKDLDNATTKYVESNTYGGFPYDEQGEFIHEK